MVKAPFVYFGGKSRIAAEVWKRLGPDVKNYVEPFCGSAAVLLKRSNFTAESGYTETINDADGMVSNFWRALKAEPEKVAEFADWICHECDLHARHIWLVNRKNSLQKKLEGNPEFYDAKIAGWWVWGMALWIGSGFCSGEGSWNAANGELTNIKSDEPGIQHQKPHLPSAGQSIMRKRPNLMTTGQGVQRQRPHLYDLGKGVQSHSRREFIVEWMQTLSERLKRVRVCCGDWGRVVTPAVTFSSFGLTAVFLDPPYGGQVGRNNATYAHEDLKVAADVGRWAIVNGENPLFRLAVCGYEGEHSFPDSWEKIEWAAQGGYANYGNERNENHKKERIWFSPHCLRSSNQTNKLLWEVTETNEE